MQYGVANKSGQPDFITAESIVATAWENGVREFDTAQAYGESEKVLGQALHSLGISNDARIISKIHPETNHNRTESLRRAVERSLSNLKVPKLFALFLHKEELLNLWDHGLGDRLRAMEEDGLVEQLGISVYSPELALTALRSDGLSMIQIPSNLLDRRFEEAGVFSESERQGKPVYVRSIFLQGLLLMDPGRLPDEISFAAPTLKKVESLAKKNGLSRQHLAIGYARMAYGKAKIVFGAETAEQVRDNIVNWKSSIPEELSMVIQELFRDVDFKILSPNLWQL
jgi:aryl-alcohol dehydrogenase-like predicted oxidoreductase